MKIPHFDRFMIKIFFICKKKRTRRKQFMPSRSREVEVIEILTRSEDDDSGSRGGDDKTELVTRALDVEKLKKKLEDFLSHVHTLIDVPLAETRAFQLAEVQFSAEITAKGDFKLLGAGVGLEGSSTITFVIRRKSEQGKE
jgi:hypothetical protein